MRTRRERIGEIDARNRFVFSTKSVLFDNYRTLSERFGVFFFFFFYLLIFFFVFFFFPPIARKYPGTSPPPNPVIDCDNITLPLANYFNDTVLGATGTRSLISRNMTARFRHCGLFKMLAPPAHINFYDSLKYRRHRPPPTPDTAKIDQRYTYLSSVIEILRYSPRVLPAVMHN